MDEAHPQVALSAHDEAHLEWAATLARRGWGQVNPNPMVGCVLVRDGRVVAEGWHEVFGGPHAEIVALEQALTAAEGATAYVSLEPCNHHGKTPPCSEALVAAGVSRVVFGAADPGADSGGGAATLRAAGIEVVGPVWSGPRAQAENPAFHHVARSNTPFLALKLAMSLDGRIAAAPGVRTRITGGAADREVHRLRAGFDAVMIGSGTARADDPRLTVRLAPPGREQPRRIVLSSNADLDPASALFDDVDVSPLHVFCRTDASEGAIERLEAQGAHVHPVPAASGRSKGPAWVDLDAVLVRCFDLGMRAILCEGGAALAERLLAERRVHRFYAFVAPMTLGRRGQPAFGSAQDQLRWDDFHPIVAPEAFGRDTLITLDRREDS